MAQAAEAVLGKHAQTVYEGDPTMPPDMDVIMANIANAIGIEAVRRTLLTGAAAERARVCQALLGLRARRRRSSAQDGDSALLLRDKCVLHPFDLAHRCWMPRLSAQDLLH